MYEHLRAENVRKLARDYHVNNMSEELKDLLDTVYVASRNGKTAINIKEDIKINNQDISVLRLLGYNVAFTNRTSEDGENTYINTVYIGW